MKMNPTRSLLLALALAAFALPSFAAPTATKISKLSQAKLYNSDGSMTANNGTGGFGGGAALSHWFDGKKKTDGSDMWGGGGTYLPNLGNGGYCILDFTDDASDGYFVTQVCIAQCNAHPYSIYWSDDGTTWNAVSGAQNVSYVGEGVYGVNKIATHLKIVFNETGGWDLNICEIEAWGYEPVKPTNVASVSKAKLYNSDGSMTANNGTGGFGGGAALSHWFDGKKKTDGSDMWGGGGTYLPNLGNGGYCVLDFSNDLPDGYFVTDVAISQCNAHPYSIYWSTNGTEWTAVPGAQNVSYVGEGIYGVNKIAKFVKIVFNETGGWDLNICEIEVWGMDPDDITCLHENMTDESPAWVRYQEPTCTVNAREERFCPDCGERFEREALLTALGHIYVATLIEAGTVTSYGRGEVTCSREGCDYHIDFDGQPIDLATLGGEPYQGVVQYTDLTASSTGGQDGGICPGDVIDGVWDMTWNGYWFATSLSTNEYIQFKFGTTMDLTKIEYSVMNQDQTVYFNKYDPATGEETLLRSEIIVKDTSDGAPNYQRRTVTFTREAEGGEEPAPSPAPGRRSAPAVRSPSGDSNASGITVDAIRMRIGDVLDPETGEVVKKYMGTQYTGSSRNTVIIEVHPYGTIAGASKVDSGAKPAFLFMQ